MGELCIAERTVVVPGQVLAKGMDFLPGYAVFRDGEELVATRVGIAEVRGRLVKITPLAGAYVPKRDDLIIGHIVDIALNGWRVDFGWAYEANLSPRDAVSEFVERGADLSQYYDVDDYIMAQIAQVVSAKFIDLSMKGPGLRKLGPGTIIEVNPAKVPRIIGKQGSMISMVKEKTGCRISVGQNGIVWLCGQTPAMERLAISAIRQIEAESHTSGLTDRIKVLLEREGLQHDVQQTV